MQFNIFDPLPNTRLNIRYKKVHKYTIFFVELQCTKIVLQRKEKQIAVAIVERLFSQMELIFLRISDDVNFGRLMQRTSSEISRLQQNLDIL